MAIEAVNNMAESDLDELQVFLKEWDKKYLDEVNKIPLFDQNQTKNWSEKQKSYFIKIFYHVRGYFHDFLWYMGNFAPDKKSKEAIVSNILEEFGGDNLSHEQLYFNFANSFGVDLYIEKFEQTNYLSFVKEFNRSHLKWLQEHNWSEKMAAFSAYEKLDNIDYKNLLDLAYSIGAAVKNVEFFIIHNNANHFESTLKDLQEIWRNNRVNVEDAFEFIREQQIVMWKTLSKCIFALVEVQ